MAMWPFSKKRRSQSKDPGPRTVSTPPPTLLPPSDTPTALPEMPSEKEKQKQAVDAARKQRRTSWRSFTESKKKRAMSPGKENIPPPSRGSVEEDLTALPNARQLESSPHLRPVDSSRLPPPIPYNFNQNTTSQTSIPHDEARTGSRSRPGTVRSKRSGLESSSSKRRPSTKRRQEDKLREEEIRAMSAPIAIPKRQGEGVLRKDSKKMRSLGTRGSMVSLPPEDSIHSSMSASVEQRGWEVGSLDIFNPRPAVRLSGAPQHVTPQSAIGTSYGTSYTIPEEPRRDKEKRPVTREGRRKKKRDVIGDHADELGASELRMLMERDAHRREQRQKSQHEKLDRKLRSRAGRERAESVEQSANPFDDEKAGLSRQHTEEAARQDPSQPSETATTPRFEVRRLLSDEEIARRLMTPPTAIHPALRDAHAPETAEVGLGVAEHPSSQPINTERDLDSAMPTTDDLGTSNTGTYMKYPAEKDIPENPFEDAPSPPQTEAELLGSNPITPGALSALETPMEEPAVIGTAQAVRLSQTPISLQMTGSTEPSNLSQSTLSKQADSAIIADRTPVDPQPKERRAGAWASFFRRGTTRKTSDTPVAQGSFSNASRESMRNQPLPPHLVDTMPIQQERRRSGTPVRTMSKFREDLPELPISPPDSRTQSPDVTTMAAAAALARRPHRNSRQLSQEAISFKGSDNDLNAAANRTDAPISPGSHRRALMSPSLASIGSEGSWLASGGSLKRRSGQSGLGRGMSSLDKRRPEFTSSYEELGGDKDADYFQSMSSPGQNREAVSPLAISPLVDASLDEASEYDHYDTAPVSPEPEGTPTPAEREAQVLTVHGSMRRKPTLVHRDARVKSREGLLASLNTNVSSFEQNSRDPSSRAQHSRVSSLEHQPEGFTAPLETVSPVSSPTTPTARGSEGRDSDDYEPESPAPQLHSATSVNYGRGHARHVSAGSAVLLDMPKRASTGDFEKMRSNETSPQSLKSGKSRPTSQPVGSLQRGEE